MLIVALLFAISKQKQRHEDLMKIVNVRIKYGGQIMAYKCGDLNPSLGDWVVVKCSDLVYMGQVVCAPIKLPDPIATKQLPTYSPSQLKYSKMDASRQMIRLATDADIARQAEKEVRERDAFHYCQEQAAIQKLALKLVAVEVLFDGSKTVFYYTAEERIDFRLLVKDLVSKFRNRIEMRQIGVRHEARMIGGLGGCGRQFCCSSFLADFNPVSVKMAKEQNISLNPAKISGICGRLMCCLAFEQHDQLEVEKTSYPDHIKDKR